MFGGIKHLSSFWIISDKNYILYVRVCGQNAGCTMRGELLQTQKQYLEDFSYSDQGPATPSFVESHFNLSVREA